MTITINFKKFLLAFVFIFSAIYTMENQNDATAKLLNILDTSYTNKNILQDKWEEIMTCIDQGADINVGDTQEKKTLFHKMLWKENGEKNKFSIEQYNTLLEKNADPNAQDKHGTTLVNYAIWYESPDVTKLLIERNADVNRKYHFKKSPLALAVSTYKKNFEIAKQLCMAGAQLLNVNENNNNNIFHELIGNKEEFIQMVMIHAHKTQVHNLFRPALEICFVLNYLKIPKDLHLRILFPVFAKSQNKDDFTKKLNREIFAVTCKDPLVYKTHEHVLWLEQILQSKNDKNKTALEYFELQNENNRLGKNIASTLPLFNGERLDHDFIEFMGQFPTILKLESAKNNVICKIYNNYADKSKTLNPSNI